MQFESAISGKPLEEIDIKTNISSTCLDESIDLHGIGKQFTTNAWPKFLRKVAEKHKGGVWSCTICLKSYMEDK